MRRFSSIFAMCLMLASNCQSQEVVNVNEPTQDQGIESWYLHFAVGYGKPFYASSLQEHLKHPVSRSMDLVGVYWPLRGNHTILGGSVSAIVDQYTQQQLYSFSIMHFFNNVIGSGIFIRGDAGIAMLIGETEEYTGLGVGCLVGGGYSIPVSNETRITMNLQYGIRVIKAHVHGALGINVGILL